MATLHEIEAENTEERKGRKKEKRILVKKTQENVDFLVWQGKEIISSLLFI